MRRLHRVLRLDGAPSISKMSDQQLPAHRRFIELQGTRVSLNLEAFTELTRQSSLAAEERCVVTGMSRSSYQLVYLSLMAQGTGIGSGHIVFRI